MYLTSLRLQNFRCFEHIELDALDRLAVLVGENDAGKTVMLDAIAVLVGAAACGDDHFRRSHDGVKATAMEVAGTFQLEAHDTVPDEFRVGAAPGELRLRRRWAAGVAEVHAWIVGFDDADYDDFNGADRQKELLKRADVVPASREPERREQLAKLVEDGVLSRTTPREVKLASFAMLMPCMPRIERIASNEYRSPETMIQRTLQAAAASVMSPVDPTSGQPKERRALAAMRGAIIKRLNAEIADAKDVLQRTHAQLRDLHVEPNIDFTRAVTTTTLTVNIGGGDHLLSSYGDGTKKRIWMGLMEWERRAAKANIGGSVIRLYDEPDVNLHYNAQRQLFATVSSLACDVALRTQCFVCTHAVTLIDRAPCEAVNLIHVEPDGARRLQRIGTGSDAEVMAFFNEVGRAVGLSNTVLLYERGFLLVEGDSEVVSLPILYRTLFGRLLAEDGIVIVNLHTCGAWRSVMEVMLRNRIPLTHMLLDADCRDPESSARITSAALAELGCNADFIGEQVTFVGEKEFEDAFADEVIAEALDTEYPRSDSASWLERVAAIKDRARGGGKFSAELHEAVRRECVTGRRSDATKPSIAAAIARRCKSDDDVPASLRDAFMKVRTRAGAAATAAVAPRSAGGINEAA